MFFPLPAWERSTVKNTHTHVSCAFLLLHYPSFAVSTFYSMTSLIVRCWRTIVEPYLLSIVVLFVSKSASFFFARVALHSCVSLLPPLRLLLCVLYITRYLVHQECTENACTIAKTRRKAGVTRELWDHTKTRDSIAWWRRGWVYYYRRARRRDGVEDLMLRSSGISYMKREKGKWTRSMRNESRC
jgi:hypothetical protein